MITKLCTLLCTQPHSCKLMQPRSTFVQRTPHSFAMNYPLGMICCAVHIYADVFFICSLWISVWSISVGDFSSCVCGVCDCLHKTSAQRYSECVLVLHEIMFHYDIEQIIWRTSKWKRTMHIRWSIKELLLISRIWTYQHRSGTSRTLQSMITH